MAMKSTTFTEMPTNRDSAFNFSAIIWIHILLLLVASLFLYPVIFVLNKRNSPRVKVLEVITLITISLGTVVTFFQSHSHSTSHSVLGFFLVFATVAYLAFDIWNSRSLAAFSKPQLTITFVRVLYYISNITLLLLLYLEIVLGVIVS